MKFFTEKKLSHKIIIAVVIVILFNFISPNIPVVKADAKTAVGGILFEPIKDLLLVIGDGIISVMQTFLFKMDTSFTTIEYDKPNYLQIGGMVITRNYNWSYCCCRSDSSDTNRRN